jgi:hypothetical protein
VNSSVVSSNRRSGTSLHLLPFPVVGIPRLPVVQVVERCSGILKFLFRLFLPRSEEPHVVSRW